MKFRPEKKSEVRAIDNHTNWQVVQPIIKSCIANNKVLISCTCHEVHDATQDTRWVFLDQIIKDAE